MATNTTSTATSARSTSRRATPWGPGELVEQAVLTQRAGDKRFTALVELLETARGERLVRFAYSTDGVARRGPVTVRVRDLGRLHAALAKTPELASTLGLGGDA
ncbi:MAG TPA: hypothetical protein VFA19_01865 [Gaiellaceae bacterium]|nr:hypothetical protein [Gaiellaceae bacterium]